MEPTTDTTDNTQAPTPDQVDAAAKAEADFNSKLVELIAEGKTDEEAREILGTTPPDDRRAADQDTATEEAFATGTLPEEDRRHNATKPSLADVPLDEPVAAEPIVGDTESSEIPEKYHPTLTRIHDILDHLVKQIDPTEKIMAQELKAILVDLGLRRP